MFGRLEDRLDREPQVQASKSACNQIHESANYIVFFKVVGLSNVKNLQVRRNWPFESSLIRKYSKEGELRDEVPRPVQVEPLKSLHESSGVRVYKTSNTESHSTKVSVYGELNSPTKPREAQGDLSAQRKITTESMKEKL